jgi:hypothetical protein
MESSSPYPSRHQNVYWKNRLDNLDIETNPEPRYVELTIIEFAVALSLLGK